VRQKFFTFLALILLVFLLVGLNAVSYVRKDVEPDTEFVPNRSTYNTGATGTRAFYDLLNETGRKPVRWQEDFSALAKDSKNKPQTLVIIGQIRKSFGEKEIEQLLSWISLGGKLVIIDRSPRENLVSTTANWKISSSAKNFPNFQTDPSDQRQMTDKVPAGMPAQPTVFTANVNAIQPSSFASSINIEKIDDSATDAPPPFVIEEKDDEEPDDPHLSSKPTPTVSQNRNAPIVKSLPTPPPVATENGAKFPTIETSSQAAPVVHFADETGKVLLADFPYGSGRIVFLSDPYIVSNAGISLVDNAQLAINVVTAGGGIIAFDEFHQGYGATENEFFAYFAGTPVIAIGMQLILLVGLIFFTQSRRFARPLPAVELSRISKLEYVSAMAELQQRTKAYDLAIENIYTDFRRRAARFFGAGNYEITRRELASKIAERLKLNVEDIEKLMQKAEEMSYGEPTNKREVLDIAARLRELEEKLNLKRTRRQTFGK
jgi:hypothetical protein